MPQIGLQYSICIMLYLSVVDFDDFHKKYFNRRYIISKNYENSTAWIFKEIILIEVILFLSVTSIYDAYLTY